MDKPRIGFIGLGAMGLPMARNLIKAGFTLHVSTFHRREPVDELVSLGAIEENSFYEIIPKVNYLITILPTDKEMEEVLLAVETKARLREGLTLVEMTSGSTNIMREINKAYSEKGVKVLDAPVSGGTVGAEKGTLTVMCGGSWEVFKEAEPIFQTIASKIYHVGEVGAGKAIKAVNQMLAGIHMVAASEALVLAQKLGIDLKVLREVIADSSGASWMFLNRMDQVMNKNFEGGFKLGLMKKDIQIAAEEGKDLHLLLAQNALFLYKLAMCENPDKDFSIVSQQVFKNA